MRKMEALLEMAIIVALVPFLCCIVGVQGQIGVTTCTFATQTFCLFSLPNSYCDLGTLLCECAVGAGYVENDDGSRCNYDCGTPAAPGNGTVDTSQGTLAGDVATYSCNNGYKVAGANTTTCVQDVGWDNTAATCVKGEIGDDCSSNAFLCGNIAFGVCQGTCQCPPGYENDGTSQNCQDIDECENAICQNGATCVDEINRYTCICAAGYNGTYCADDIHECASSPCENGGTCVDGVYDYSCTCVAGYTDKNCQTDIHECASSPCENGGTCRDDVNDYSCTCVAGYTDKNCQTDIDECENAICQNGAKCIDEINRYTCICAPGYDGTYCTNDIDECENAICQNGAKCVDEINRYTCICASGYGGTYCTNDQNDTADGSTLTVIILACSLTAVLSIALTLGVLFIFLKYKRAKRSTQTSTPEPAVYYNTAVTENVEGSETDTNRYEGLSATREEMHIYEH